MSSFKILIYLSFLFLGLSDFQVQGQPTTRIRKSVTDLSEEEKGAFIAALFRMKNTPTAGGSNVYDDLVVFHIDAGSASPPDPLAYAHRSAAFLPWHRWYIWEFEKALLQADRDNNGGLNILTGLPYWDWAVDRSSQSFPWTADFLGGNGDATRFGRIPDGPFRDTSGDFGSGEDPWIPVGDTISNDGISSTNSLRRAFRTVGAEAVFMSFLTSAEIATSDEVQDLMLEIVYDSSPFSGFSTGFRNSLERIHDSVHVAIGGHMERHFSPDDPVFYLHHANVDRIWAQWQGINGIENYTPGVTDTEPTGGGVKVDSAMGGFGSVTPGDVLRTISMEGAEGYVYLPRIPDDPDSTSRIDLILALDTSGSMSLTTDTGASKMDGAIEATDLFLSLMKTGDGHRVGLIEFNTNSTTLRSMLSFTASHQGDLQSDVSGLTAGGSTGIGEALDLSKTLLTGASDLGNERRVLLLTDGMENQSPTILDVAGLDSTGASMLGNGIRVYSVGFGSDASLDADKLTQISSLTNGAFTTANNELELKKFFVASFGDAFNDVSMLRDPYFIFEPGQSKPSENFLFNVTEYEQELTVVIGWSDPTTEIEVELVSPDGSILKESAAGITTKRGRTWMFMRLPADLVDPSSGEWEVRTTRGSNLDQAEQFFISVLSAGGPSFRPVHIGPMTYTGEPLHPLAYLRHEDGHPVSGEVYIELLSPQQSEEDILQQVEPQQDQRSIKGDVIDNRTGTLLGVIEHKEFPFSQSEEKLFDDSKNEDGLWGPDGVYGVVLDEVKKPGRYRVHAFARYEDSAGARGTREAQWSVYVDIGIDPDSSEIKLEDLGRTPDGNQLTKLIMTPQDAFGNKFGFGRGDDFQIAVFGDKDAKIMGEIVDEGAGIYSIQISSNPNNDFPNVVLMQPGRDIISLTHSDNEYIPGDCNLDGALNISDPVCLLGHLFLGNPDSLPCGTGGVEHEGNIQLLDWHGDGAIDLSDAIASLSFQFLGTAPHVLAFEIEPEQTPVPIPGCNRE